MIPNATVSNVGTGLRGLISGFFSNSGGRLILKLTSMNLMPSSYIAADVSSTDLNSKNINFFSMFLLLPMMGFPGSRMPPARLSVSNKNSFN